MSSDPPRPGTGAALPRTCTRRALLSGASATLASPALGEHAASVPAAAFASAEPEGVALGSAEVPDRSTLELFRSWDALFARINDTGTPEPEARALHPDLEALREALETEPVTSLLDLAAKVLALTGHGEFELPESLVAECEAIVRSAIG